MQINFQGNNFRVENPFNRHTNQSGRTATSRRRDVMQERAAEQEREMRLREMENERIANLLEQIDITRANENELSDDVVNLTISMLNEQINQIHMNRSEREMMAIEREMLRQQSEMEERMRERERAAEQRAENQAQNKTQEELERAQERSQIKGMTSIGATLDNISTLSRTRAQLSAAATRLEGEADFDMHRQRIANQEIRSFVSQSNIRDIEIMRETGASIRPMQIGHLFSNNPLAPDTFRGRHLANLNVGVARTNAAISSQVSAMYREGQRMQEQQLQLTREQYTAPSEEESDEEVIINAT
ncbi:MAG: hypothetical protein FWB80_13340 [Defluviitaleaceae bacterium]|nr:hypothetical protein [Defluviitaleaceae bacterium]